MKAYLIIDLFHRKVIRDTFPFECPAGNKAGRRAAMSKHPDLPYFSCFDKGNIMVLFNSFQKQANKTPKNEIALALKLKEEYFNSKKKK